jgi:ABC-type multidrug transport system fused ATPase/permease subunit
MIHTFRSVMKIVSPRLRRAIVFNIIHGAASALIDAAAFLSLYPLLIELTSQSSANSSTIKTLIHHIFGNTPKTDVEFYLGGLTVGLFILSSIVGITLVRRQCRVAAAIEQDIAIHLFSEYLEAPYLDHVTHNSSFFIRNVHMGSTDVATNVLLSYLLLIQNLLTVVFLILLIGIASPIVVFGATLYFGIAVFFYLRFITPRARSAGQRAIELFRGGLQSLQEGFGGIKALLASSAPDLVEDDYDHKRMEYAKVKYKLSLYSQLPQYYLQTIMISGMFVFVGLVIAVHVQDATALIGIIIAASLRLMPCLYQCLNCSGKIRGSQATVEVILDETKRMKRSRMGGESRQVALSRNLRSDVNHTNLVKQAPVPLEWNISLAFENVTFSYPSSEQPALSEVSFEVKKGAFVGIVGPSGAGKTTIVDLMLGLFEASSGAVTVDSQPLLGTSVVNSWREQVGYVPQDVFLLDGTIRTNIEFGLSGDDVDVDRVWRALRAAQLADFVLQLPDRLDTVLGERGVRLSGGQRQRMGIARALYRQPEILILDEATSSLDTSTEAALADTVRDLDVHHLTRIVVAHRLSTVKDCDALFLFDRGRLVGTGDFASLRRDNEMFNELARLSRIE